MEKALIHTTKGNLPVEGLDYKNGFAFTPSSITFWEEYALDGEIVKRSAHAYVLPVGTKLELHGGDIG